MKRIYAIVVGMILLVFAVAFAIPAEDSPETAYDESETQPYECAPQFVDIMAHTVGAPSESLPHAMAATPAESVVDSMHLVLVHTPSHALAANPEAHVFPIRC